MQQFIRSMSIVVLSAICALSSVLSPTTAALASPAAAKISITFDDGRVSNIAKAAPILAKYGLSATAFVVTDCVGMTTTPNTCRAADDVSYMSWDQLRTLQNTYGWEIGSHSKTHPYLASADAADGQPNLLTATQVTAELRDSKAALAAQGFQATAFASPYGDYSNATLQQIAQYYSVHRGFADQNYNVWPYNDLLLNNLQVQTPVLPATVKAKIDDAITTKTWLILTLHDIVDTTQNPSTYAYDWSTAYFEEIAAYIKQKIDAKQLSATNLTAGSVSGTNLLSGGGFDSGLTAGWRTDSPSFAANNGQLVLSASSRQAHLFSPQVSVNNSTMYVFKSYLSVSAISGGEVGYYIDEYDVNGNWISGQWKGAETEVYTQKFNIPYVPSSAAVATAQLQIYMTPMTTLSGSLDTVELLSVTTPVAPPVQTNLLTNATFDNGLIGWRTDNASLISLDSTNHGAPTNQTNSIRINGTSTGESHLFSDPVTVASGSNYTLTQYANIVTANGSGLGFYVDEYDANGNWISGKYLRWTGALGPQTLILAYTPSSPQVVSASYQLIAETGSGIDAYFDNPIWSKQ